MNWPKIGLALTIGLILATEASAQALHPRPRHYPGFRPYFGYGRYPFFRGPRFGVGLGFGFPTPSRTVYRNAFTADVTYAERATNEFRAAYERLKGDPLGLKTEIQRLDEILEGMRREAETYGDVTIRGTEMLRDARSRAEVVERRLQSENGDLRERWNRVQGLLNQLARTYRVG